MTAAAPTMTHGRAWWTFVHGAFAVTVALITVAWVQDARARSSMRDLAQASAGAAREGFSNAHIARMMRGAGPGALRLAVRLEAGSAPFQRPDMTGLRGYDFTAPPILPFQAAPGVDAARLNAVIPVSRTYNPVAAPFSLPAGIDRQQAISCLTAAVYYEAANEPRAGKEAVAQVVINRTRHPLYPKTVCGVVFQGSERYTGCQFSFTCDGSMARGPMKAQWEESRDVAIRAVSGHVMQAVGSATHYHANYVMPYWAPTLVKVAQYGLHIFYRPTGPSRLFGRYGGGEARFSKVNMIGRPQPMRMPAVITPNGQFQEFPAGFLPVQIARAAYTPDGRVRAIIGGVVQDGAAPVAPMHAMIAMRRAAARAAFDQRRASAVIAQDNARGAAAAAAAEAEAPSASAPAPAPDKGEGEATG